MKRTHYLKTLKEKGWLRFARELEREGFFVEDILEHSPKIQAHFALIKLKNKMIESFYNRERELIFDDTKIVGLKFLLEDKK